MQYLPVILNVLSYVQQVQVFFNKERWKLTLTKAPITGAIFYFTSSPTIADATSHLTSNETRHTLISSNGDLKTDRLYAEGGRLRNMTVEENCVVKGTVYANKIEGDVMRVWPIDAAGVSSTAERLVSTFDLTPYTRGRRITPIGTLTWYAVKITTQTGHVVKNYDSYQLESDVPAGTSRLHAYLRNTGYTGAVLIYL